MDHLLLKDYMPRSTLAVEAHVVERASPQPLMPTPIWDSGPMPLMCPYRGRGRELIGLTGP